MKYILTLAASLTLAATAVAQDEEDTTGWTGEGSLGAGITTGNTDTVDVSVAVKLAKDTGTWTYAAEGGYDFGQIDGVDSRNRWYVSGQADREFTDRLFGFGRVSYEQDEFSGFDSRLFLGLGGGYHIFKQDKLRWSVDVAPGFRLDEVADTIDPGPPVIVLVEGGNVSNFAVRGGSHFGYDFNENVTFTNDTDVVWTDLSTQTINTAAVTAQLTQAISGRVSFEVRHDTNPPDGFVNTDTATRVSVVYGF